MVLALAGLAGRAEATKQDGGRTAGVRGFACAVWTFGGAAREVRIAFELPAGMESCVFLTRPYRTDDCLGTTSYATREVAACKSNAGSFRPDDPAKFLCNDSSTRAVHALPLLSFEGQTAYNLTSLSNARNGECTFADVFMVVRNMCTPPREFAPDVAVGATAVEGRNRTAGRPSCHHAEEGSLALVLTLVIWLNVSFASLVLAVVCVACPGCPASRALRRWHDGLRIPGAPPQSPADLL